MISAIRRLFNELSGEGGPPRPFGEDDYRLAAAALLYHATAIDGEVTDEERKTLRSVLRDRFDLEDDEAEELVEAAEAADSQAVDLYGFTSVLKRRLDEAEREHIVEMMWTLVYADGRVHEFEDNLIWRVAELLAVSPKARIRLKQAVRANAGG